MLEAKSNSQRLKNECAPLILSERVIKKRLEGNILHCTKRIQNKTKLSQWRLLIQYHNGDKKLLESLGRENSQTMLCSTTMPHVETPHVETPHVELPNEI